jgi:hypothetical protein
VDTQVVTAGVVPTGSVALDADFNDAAYVPVEGSAQEEF